MFSILIQMLMIFIVLIIMLILLNLVSKKNLLDREKNSPFECGFNPKNSARLPFSLQFFLIAIIFLIFDVELTLLLPTVLIMKFSNSMNFILMMNIFIIILIFGVIHEQKEGALNWMK